MKGWYKMRIRLEIDTDKPKDVEQALDLLSQLEIVEEQVGGEENGVLEEQGEQEPGESEEISDQED
jgi:hypothetical protein